MPLLLVVVAAGIATYFTGVYASRKLDEELEKERKEMIRSLLSQDNEKIRETVKAHMDLVNDLLERIGNPRDPGQSLRYNMKCLEDAEEILQSSPISSTKAIFSRMLNTRNSW